MNRLINIFFIVLISGLSSCIEPFSLNVGSGGTEKYVLFGQLTDQEGYQTISISKTSTIEQPHVSPLSGCNVKIIDNLGNEFKLDESEVGNYRVWMGKEYLKPGNSYQIRVLTSSNVEIVSDFDQMPEGSEIDSIYYMRKDIPTTVGKSLQGIQFYIDVNGTNSTSHYYKWDIIETWEHHAPFPKSFYWNQKAIVAIVPVDYSTMVCWNTTILKNIYTLSTENLVQNKYKMNKLHFVDNSTQRLTYCYSLLINQLALSKPAYEYWNSLRINNDEQGGLYNVQPLNIKGNLKCISNPKLGVLGYFSATSVRTKRIFVRNVKNLDLLYPQCKHDPVDVMELKKRPPSYLIYVGGVVEEVENSCVECNIYGIGSTIKPNYWPY